VTERPPAHDVAVCVVSWNGAHHLRNLLPALPAATEGIDAQVVVVDNGSADDTEDVLAEHPSVEVVANPENRGITRARNQALMVQDARVVVMLDNDTIPRPGSITAMVRYLDEHPEVGLVGARLLNPDGTVQESCRTVPPVYLPLITRPPFERFGKGIVDRHYMRDFDHATTRPVDWVMGACQGYRASLLPLLGAYDERIFSHGGEDTDWCLRVWKAGYEVHYLAEAEMEHAYGHFARKNPLSRQARRALGDYLYMVWKHRDVREGVAR